MSVTVHRDVFFMTWNALGKTTIDLLYFWDVCDVNLWGKSFDKSTTYSCRT